LTNFENSWALISELERDLAVEKSEKFGFAQLEFQRAIGEPGNAKKAKRAVETALDLLQP